MTVTKLALRRPLRSGCEPRVGYRKHREGSKERAVAPRKQAENTRCDQDFDQTQRNTVLMPERRCHEDESFQPHPGQNQDRDGCHPAHVGLDRPAEQEREWDKNVIASAFHVRGAHEPCIRWAMNSVSSRRSPYQITKYCDHSM